MGSKEKRYKKLRIIKETCVSGAVVDVVIKGSRTTDGKKRAPRENATPEAVRKNNDRIACKNLERILNANFYPGDYHVTLTYADAPKRRDAEREMKNFLRRMKREAKKLDIEFRYVAVTEYEHTRIHHHIVMSYIDKRVIDKQWQNGRILLSTLDKSRSYRKLAEYLVKETQKTFRDPDNATKRRYSCSRNLVKPVIAVQEVSILRLFEDPKPLKGYAIDEDSVNRFDNPVTGLTHLEYSMISTDPTPRMKKWRAKGCKMKKSTESFTRFEGIKQLEFGEEDFWMK